MPFEPPAHVLVRFKDDDVLLHHRWILKVSKDGRSYWVATPDREVWKTRLRLGDKYAQIVPFSGTRLPGKVRRAETYMDKDSELGPFRANEYRALLKKCVEKDDDAEDLKDAKAPVAAVERGARRTKRSRSPPVAGVLVPRKQDGDDGIYHGDEDEQLDDKSPRRDDRIAFRGAAKIGQG